MEIAPPCSSCPAAESQLVHPGPARVAPRRSRPATAAAAPVAPRQRHHGPSTPVHMRLLLPLAELVLLAGVEGHGHITWPPSRTNASLASGGYCGGEQPCSWFSQPTEIPGDPTLPDYARTYNTKVNSGPDDWSRKMPWRAPGSAPVLGSGCGVAGGGPLLLPNGGNAAPGYAQGADFLTIPQSADPTVWHRGNAQEVSWALWANHGGGVSWRLCKKSENVSEDCFARNSLEFVGDQNWIRYTPIHGYTVRYCHSFHCFSLCSALLFALFTLL
jgi:hypothetical protein